VALFRQAGALRVKLQRSAIGEPAFRRFLGAVSASLTGDYVVLVAVPFAVFALGGSALEVGIAFGLYFGSIASFGLLGGEIGDRLPRRAVMVGADLARFVAQGAFGLLYLLGNAEVWHLYVSQVLVGVGTAAFYPSINGLVSETVPMPAKRQGANSLRSLADASARMLGPALGGLLVALVGIGWAFLVDAASYLASALLLASIKLAPEKVDYGEGVRGLRHGWHEFRRTTWLWIVVAVMGLLNGLAFGPFQVLGSALSKETLGGAGAWATVLACLGLGALCGCMVALAWRPPRPLMVAVLGIGAFAIPMTLLASSAPLAAVALGALVAGLGGALFDALWDTAVQNHVRLDMQSRLSSYDVVGSFAFLPIGYVLAAVAISTIGPAAGLLVASVLVVAGAGLMLCSRSIRELGPTPGAGLAATAEQQDGEVVPPVAGRPGALVVERT